MKAYMVDRTALAHNIGRIVEKADGVTVWGVIKGDGYGLGCVELARILDAKGVDHFAVTELSEVRALREAGFHDNPILMMEGTCNPETVNELLDLQAIFTVGSPEDAEVLNRIALERSGMAEAHVKIDTGMGRYGFLPEQTDTVTSLYHRCPGIAFTGIYTHFCCAVDPVITQRQYDRFQQVVQGLQAAGIETGMVHCCNSTAFWKYDHMHCDGVRIGSAILGRVAFSEENDLIPVGWCRAELEEIRMLPAGHSVGYGSGWTAKRDTRIAVLSVGYINGFGVDRGFDLWRFRDCLRGMARYAKAFLRHKSLWVRVNGTSCRVLGHVGMVNMVIDVTDCPCRVGDFARVEINPLLVKNMEIQYFDCQSGRK